MWNKPPEDREEEERVGVTQAGLGLTHTYLFTQATPSEVTDLITPPSLYVTAVSSQLALNRTNIELKTRPSGLCLEVSHYLLIYIEFSKCERAFGKCIQQFYIIRKARELRLCCSSTDVFLKVWPKDSGSTRMKDVC